MAYPVASAKFICMTKYHSHPCLKASASIRNVHRRSILCCANLQSNPRSSLAPAVITSTCPAKEHSEALAFVATNAMPPSEPSAPRCSAHESLMTSAPTWELPSHRAAENRQKPTPEGQRGIPLALPLSFDRRGNQHKPNTPLTIHFHHNNGGEKKCRKQWFS